MNPRQDAPVAKLLLTRSRPETAPKHYSLVLHLGQRYVHGGRGQPQGFGHLFDGEWTQRLRPAKHQRMGCFFLRQFNILLQRGWELSV